MSALIPALIQLAMSGRGRGGGGGGYSRGGGGGYSRGGGGRGGYGSRGRQPFDPQGDLDRKAGQFLHGAGSNPFRDSASYKPEDKSEWSKVFAALGGEMEYPEPEIPEDIYVYPEEE